MPTVKFVKENKQIAVNSCTNLRKVAKKNKVEIYEGLHKYFNCHGLGLCGTCVIEVPEGSQLSPKKRGEDKILEKRKMNGDNRRLACQCLIYDDVEVTTLS